MSENLIFETLEVLGEPAVRVQAADGAHATVLLHGAQVVSWVPAGGEEQLYLSPKAVAGEGKAVRGGVPVIFPQFELRGPDTSLPRHGFARTRRWTVESSRRDKDCALLTLVLDDSAETRAIWPHAFTLELTISVGAGRLDLELYAHNPGDNRWPFAAALHTYLGVSELSHVRLQGLEGCRYEDRVVGGETLEDHPEKRFHGEVDRIYAHTRDLLLRDGPRRLSIESAGFSDTVIWNPGPEKCAALPDMPAEGWQHMLCIEAAQVLKPVTLGPDEEWSGRQSFSLLAA